MYTRLLVKFSGELFGGEGECFSGPHLRYIISETKKAIEAGAKVAIVVGGGNIFRGRIREDFGLEQANADKIGIQGTEVNTLMLQEVFRSCGIPAQGFSAISDGEFLSRYTIDAAREAYEQGKVVILGGGSGNPYFTTDTAAVLRALELGCEVVCKATTVDGVYDSDPKKNKKAVKFETLHYEEAISRELQVMDQTAFMLAMESALPIVVYQATRENALTDIVHCKKIGTLVSNSPVVCSTLVTKKEIPISLAFSQALPAGELLKKIGKDMLDTR